MSVDMIIAAVMAGSGKRVLIGATDVTIGERLQLLEEIKLVSTDFTVQRSSGWATHPSGGALLLAGSDQQVIGHRFDDYMGELTPAMRRAVRPQIDPTPGDWDGLWAHELPEEADNAGV